MEPSADARPAFKANPLADVRILGPHLSKEVSLTLIIHRGLADGLKRLMSGMSVF